MQNWGHGRWGKENSGSDLESFIFKTVEWENTETQQRVGGCMIVYKYLFEYKDISHNPYIFSLFYLMFAFTFTVHNKK